MRTVVRVPFHQQNTTVLCGPACMQMVLARLGFDLSIVTQRALYDIAKLSPFDPGESIKWKSFPDGIVNALNVKARRHGPFVLYCSRRAEDLTQIICLALRQHDTTPIVLFYDAEHWVVARGFIWDEAASAGGPFQVKSLYVHDPWPNLGTVAGVIHSANDGCGSGYSTGWPQRHIMISDWYTDKLTGVQRPSRWRGLCLAICPEVDVPPHIPVQVCTDGACSRSCGPPVGPRLGHGISRGTGGGSPISHDEASRRAWEQLNDEELEIDPRWREALAESEPGMPLLVERRDRAGGAYYLVPFVTDDQRVPLLVKLDAATGEYRESVVVPGGTTHLLENLTLDSLYRRERVVLTDSGEEVTITGLPDARSDVRLVWEPSDESRSPFWPFYEATVDETRSVYIRIDGQAFSELHEAEP